MAFQVKGFAFAYNVAFGAQMAMIGLARLRHRYQHASGLLLLPAAVIASWLLLVAPALFAPMLATSALQSGTMTRALVAFIGILAVTLAFDRIRRDLRDYPCDAGRWRLQAALGALGSVIGMAPVLWGQG